jgi:hypothetical protein
MGACSYRSRDNHALCEKDIFLRVFGYNTDLMAGVPLYLGYRLLYAAVLGGVRYRGAHITRGMENIKALQTERQVSIQSPDFLRSGAFFAIKRV